MNVMAILLAFACMALTVTSGGQRSLAQLRVKLEMVGNSEIKTTFTNGGKRGIKVLKAGSILDSAAVHNAKVTANGKLTRSNFELLSWSLLKLVRPLLT